MARVLSTCSLTALAAVFAGLAFSQQPSSKLAAEELLHSAHVWEAHDRGDLARHALEKLATARSNSPEALLELGELHLRMADVEDARKVLTTLRKRWPKAAATRAFEIEFRLATSDRLQLASIQRLIDLGRGAEARKELDRLLPHGAPGGIFDLEYYRLLAAMPGGAPIAEQKLRELAARHPNDSRYPLALARQLIKREATRPEGARLLTALEFRDDIRAAEVKNLLARASSAQQAPEDQEPRFVDKKAEAQHARAQQEQRLLVRGTLAKISPEQQRENLSAMRTALHARAESAGDEALAIADWLHGEPSPQAFESSNAALIAGQFVLRARQSIQTDQLEVAEAQTAAAIAFNSARYEDAIAVAERLEHMERREESGQVLAAASRLQPESTWLFETYVRWLINHQQVDAALQQLDRRVIDAKWRPADRDALRATALDQRAQQALAAGNLGVALKDLEAAVELAPSYPWTRYRLAGLYQRRGQQAAAREVLDEGVGRAPGHDEMHYARALYLASVDDVEGALQDIHIISPHRRSTAMEGLQQRLFTARKRVEVRRLQDSGDWAAARARLESLLKEQPNDRPLRVLQADFELSAGNTQQARDLYAALVAENPEDWDTRLSYTRALIESGDTDLARMQLRAVEEALPPEQTAQRITLAYRQRQMGDLPGASRTVSALLDAPPVLPDALLLAGYVNAEQKQFEQAHSYFRRAAEQQQDAATATSAREALERLNARRRSWVEASIEMLSKPGDSGISEYNSVVMPTTWTYAYDYERRFTLHADAVTLDAGALPADFSGSALLGTLQAFGPATPRSFSNGRESGMSLGAGYSTDRFSADIGTTPLGFLMPRLVGGAAWNMRWGSVNADLGISRRAIDSSLLSYAGLRDPITGRKWGAVVETGPYLSLGLYREQYSISGSLRRTSLTGKNVLDNNFSGARVAAHRRIWSNGAARAYAGSELSYWSYGHNLQNYTFGSGGYYSPQSYLNVAIPVELVGSHRGFSYQLRARVSHTSSDRDAIAFYPTDSALQAAAQNPLFDDEKSSGLSLSFYAALERRGPGPWVWGAKFDLDRADYYEPTILSFYVRRALRGSTSVIEAPPRPVRPYVE